MRKDAGLAWAGEAAAAARRARAGEGGGPIEEAVCTVEGGEKAREGEDDTEVPRWWRDEPDEEG